MDDDDDVVVAERSEAVVVVVNASPKDELCLYCGRCCNQPIMYFAALVLSLFLDGARNYCHSRSRCINVVCILRLDRRERSCDYTDDDSVIDGTNRFVSSRAF